MIRMKLTTKHKRLVLPILLFCLMAPIALPASASMNGIDISGYQKADVPLVVPADFVIVKATQGMRWSNPNYSAQIANADRAGKATGVYHFANGGSATAEADMFVNSVRPRIGRSVLALDWEECLAYGRHGCTKVNPNWGNPAWIQAWVTRVHDRTQVWPIVYVQRSAVWQLNAFVRKNCMLWVAQYANSAPTGYQNSPWNAGASGEGMIQYSGTGYLNGRGPLDLNRFFGDSTAWQKIACGERAGCTISPPASPPPSHDETTTTDLNMIATAVIRGEYGNGQIRRERLGDNYDRVMAIVNARLGAGSSHPTTVTRPTTRTYMIRAGDTVSAIAERTGLKPASAWHVPSGNINRIYPGQVITYYGKTATAGASGHYGRSAHVVRAGESLWSIYGTGWKDAAVRNGLKPPYLIYPGQRLI